MDFTNIINNYIDNYKIEKEKFEKEKLEKEKFEKEKLEKEKLEKEKLEKEKLEKEKLEKELNNNNNYNNYNNNYNKISLKNFNIKYLDSIMIDFFNYLSQVHDGRLYYLGITFIFISLIYFIVKFIIIKN
jgi:hypothetical protein